MEKNRWGEYVRPQDLVWLLLIPALAVFGPDRTPEAISTLIGLAVFQALLPRIPWFQTHSGNIVGIAIKLVLCFLVIGFTDGVASSYYLILLLPVMSAATTLGLAGAVLFSLLACATYLSFLWRLDWERQFIPEDQVRELALRVIFFPVVAYLTHQLAQSSRVESLRYQHVAEQLAIANQSLREAEAAARRSERLVALGQMSAGLAHELRNPLGTMKASAEMLAKNVTTGSDVAKELASYISTEVDRTNSLITRFLDFARPLTVQKEVNDLAAMIDRAVDQAERHTPPLDVSIYKNYSPDIPPFPFDAELMERVIYNLVVNAAQASPSKGAVTVKTRETGHEVEIAVIDRGSGIDPANRESIFNPFFTTKAAGVGLGLAIVSKIVDEHGGRIQVDSEKGEGSVFRVLLPMN